MSWRYAKAAKKNAARRNEPSDDESTSFSASRGTRYSDREQYYSYHPFARSNYNGKTYDRVTAWKERRELDGNCDFLKGVRRCYKTDGSVSSEQAAGIERRLKKFERIRGWLQDHKNRYKWPDLREYWIKQKNLTDKQIERIVKTYGRDEPLTDTEAYWFWKRLKFKMSECTSSYESSYFREPELYKNGARIHTNYQLKIHEVKKQDPVPWDWKY